MSRVIWGDQYFLAFLLISDAFCKVEMPTQYCLALLELNGIGFSTVACETQKHIMQAKLNEIETQAYQLAGHSFSLTSPDDIAEVFEGLGCDRVLLLKDSSS